MKNVILTSAIFMILLLSLSAIHAEDNTTDFKADFQNNETSILADENEGDDVSNQNTIDYDTIQGIIIRNNPQVYDESFMIGLQNSQPAQALIQSLYYNSLQFAESYDGDNNFNDSELYKAHISDDFRLKLKLCIKDPTIMQCDLKKVFGNPATFQATFYDNYDNRIKNAQITFLINGLKYSRTTNEYGVAKININLQPGEYTITSYNPVSRTNKASKIIILPNMDQNKDIVKYFKNDTQYTVRLLDDMGKPVANKTVTFNINGVFYQRVSNSTGYAKLNINLIPGTYIITAEYENCRLSNSITVLPTIIASDLSMSYMDGSQFQARLIDGKGNAIVGVNVTFNVNGVFYQRTTDENGTARLNIRLMPGEYIITSMYGDLSMGNNIRITSV